MNRRGVPAHRVLAHRFRANCAPRPL